MLKLGSIVSIQNNVRIGVVVEFFTVGRRNLACVHYIDLNTGKGELWVCPDHARCERRPYLSDSLRELGHAHSYALL